MAETAAQSILVKSTQKEPEMGQRNKTRNKTEQ